jgi:hypothetical protein
MSSYEGTPSFHYGCICLRNAAGISTLAHSMDDFRMSSLFLSGSFFRVMENVSQI